MHAIHTAPLPLSHATPHTQRGRADMEFWALLILAVIGLAGGWWWMASLWWGLAGLLALPLGVGLLVFAISWVVTRNE